MDKKIIIIILSALFIFQFFLYFGDTITDSKIIRAGDANYATLYGMQKADKVYNRGDWINYQWMGKPSFGRTFSFPSLFYAILPVTFAFHFNFIFPLFLLFITTFLLLRAMKFPLPVNIISSLMMAFAPNLVTYIEPGHIGKSYTFALIPLALLFIQKIIFEQDRKLIYFLAVGAILGLAFNHGATQTCLFFAVLLSAYYVIMLPRNSIKEWISPAYLKKAWKPLLMYFIVPVIAFLTAYGVISTQLGIGSVANPMDFPVMEDNNPNKNEQTWEWATQWSFPPEEVIDLMAPGIFGVKTGDPKSPYWGRTGRSSTWSRENPRAGWMNYSSTSNYLGLFMVLFALVAVVFVNRRETNFWKIALLVALMLAMGRFFYVYKLFYMIPGMSAARNPNKFLHLVHFICGILAAYGLRYVYETAKAYIRPQGQESSEPSPLVTSLKHQIFMVLLWAIGVVAVLAMFYVLINSNSIRLYFSKVYDMKNANMIANNIFISLLVFVLFYGVAVGILVPLLWAKLRQQIIFDLLLALIFVFTIIDQYRVSRKYINYFEYDIRSTLKEDALIKDLKTKDSQDPGRIKFAPRRSPYLKNILDNLVVVFGLETVDTPAARTTPDDWKTYERHMPRNMKKHYDLMNVKYIILDSPQPVFNLQPTGQYKNPFSPNANVYLYHNSDAMDKFSVVHDVQVRTNLSSIFGYMSSPEFDYRRSALLVHPGDYQDKVPAGSNVLPQTPVEIVDYRPTRIELKCNMPAKGLLVNATYFHPGWKVKVNGKKRDLIRANYLSQGVFLDVGENKIIFEYNTGRLTWFLGIISLLLIIGLAAWMIRQRQEGWLTVKD